MVVVPMVVRLIAVASVIGPTTATVAAQPGIVAATWARLVVAPEIAPQIAPIAPQGVFVVATVGAQVAT
jgi:hypothetical protein